MRFERVADEGRLPVGSRQMAVPLIDRATFEFEFAHAHQLRERNFALQFERLDLAFRTDHALLRFDADGLQILFGL